MENKLIITESSENLRRLSREALVGHWKEGVLAVLIFQVLYQIPAIILNSAFGVTATSVYNQTYFKNLYSGNSFDLMQDGKYSGLSSIYVILVVGPLTYGICLFFINLFRKGKPSQAMVMSGFEQFGKTLGLMLYMLLFVFLWSLLFVIPGIIAAFRYSQAFYILVDNPNKSITQCVNESKDLMQGNKGKFFCMMFSFIGWAILATIPVGIFSYLGLFSGSYFISEILMFVGSIGTFVVFAYMKTATVAFYDILTGRLKADTYIPGEY